MNKAAWSVVDALERLKQALRVLPGVGERSSTRMAYHLLQHQREGALALAHALTTALGEISHCRSCNSFSSQELCKLCQNPERDDSLLCVLEWPQDILAVEASGSFKGRYFVLMGALSPATGIGPDELAMAGLKQQLELRVISEIIVATSFTPEGEATAHYLKRLCAHLPLRLSRLARGIPLGSDVDSADAPTLAHALVQRHLL